LDFAAAVLRNISLNLSRCYNRFIMKRGKNSNFPASPQRRQVEFGATSASMSVASLKGAGVIAGSEPIKVANSVAL
jgi:hypothetical protein